MKVLKQGKVENAPPAWWVGAEPVCLDCGAQVRLEAKDQVLPLPPSHPADLWRVRWTCPTCLRKQTHQHQEVAK